MEDDVSEPRDRQWEAVALCLLIAVAVLLSRGVLRAYAGPAGQTTRERLSVFAASTLDPTVAMLVVASALSSFLAVRTVSTKVATLIFDASFVAVAVVVASALYEIWDTITASSNSLGGLHDANYRTAGVLVTFATGLAPAIALFALRRNVRIPKFFPEVEDE